MNHLDLHHPTTHHHGWMTLVSVVGEDDISHLRRTMSGAIDPVINSSDAWCVSMVQYMYGGEFWIRCLSKRARQTHMSWGWMVGCDARHPSMQKIHHSYTWLLPSHGMTNDLPSHASLKGGRFRKRLPIWFSFCYSDPLPSIDWNHSLSDIINKRIEYMAMTRTDEPSLWPHTFSLQWEILIGAWLLIPDPWSPSRLK